MQTAWRQARDKVYERVIIITSNQSILKKNQKEQLSYKQTTKKSNTQPKTAEWRFWKDTLQKCKLSQWRKMGEKKKHKICQVKYKPQYFENQLGTDMKVNNFFLLK